MQKKLLLILSMVILTSQMMPALAEYNEDQMGPPPLRHLGQKNGQFDKQKMKEHHKKMEEKHKEAIAKELGLTEKQKEKAKAMRQKGRKEIAPIMNKITELKKKIHEKRSTGASMNELQPLFEKLKPLKEQRKKILKKHIKEFEALLTPKQKEKFNELKERKKQKMEKRRHKRKGGFNRPKPHEEQ